MAKKMEGLPAKLRNLSERMEEGLASSHDYVMLTDAADRIEFLENKVRYAKTFLGDVLDDYDE